MENSTGNSDKKSTKTDLNDKTKEGRWNMQEQKARSNTINNYNTTLGNKSGSTGERRKIKDISTKGKTIQTKQDISKRRKKILLTTERR